MVVFSSAGDLLTAERADNVVERILETLKTDGDTRVHGGGGLPMVRSRQRSVSRA